MAENQENIDKICKFSLKFADKSIGDDNISDEFLIVEHSEKDDFEYRNGMLAFNLSEKKLKDMAKSFSKQSLGRDLYINYDHESTGSTLAAGWFRNVRAGKTENGYGLFAKAEWAPKAKKHIEDKEYQYFSMECQIEGMVAKWSDGEIAMDFKVKKSCLTGGALTNNPFFKTTNLSLSNENLTEDNMPKEAELIAEIEQLKLDKASEINVVTLKLSNLEKELTVKDANILELSNKIAEIELSNKKSIIASFVSKLPDDAEKRSAVTLKLENLADKLGVGADFSEMAELIIKQNDTRIVVPKVGDLKLSNDDVSKSITVAEFADLQNKLQYNK
jgi:phage I-like protein